MRGIIGTGELPRGDGLRVVVREGLDFLGSESQPPHDLRETDLESPLFRSVGGFSRMVGFAGNRPVKQRPQVALQNGALQRILNQFLGMGLKKSIQCVKRAGVRFRFQQVRRKLPEERVERVLAIAGSRRILAYEERAVKLVPRMRRIWVVDGDLDFRFRMGEHGHGAEYSGAQKKEEYDCGSPHERPPRAEQIYAN